MKPNLQFNHVIIALSNSQPNVTPNAPPNTQPNPMTQPTPSLADKAAVEEERHLAASVRYQRTTPAALRTNFAARESPGYD